jgi:RimJ/RimL family protein N-acetyltransferase
MASFRTMAVERPLGPKVDWSGAPAPAREPLRGRYVELLPPDLERDAGSLYAVSHLPDGDPAVWDYLFEGPFGSPAEFRGYFDRLQAGDETSIPFVVVPTAAGRAEGHACYLRIDPENGSIEVGNIMLGPGLQRTTAATEAIYLMAKNAFETLGYRRFEWKCNALNGPSMRAAARFGFSFEGIFRQHMVRKGRNRDTAWFSILDSEWPAIAAEYARWLDPENFDAEGRQRTRLSVPAGAPAPG